jgi:hypothetical protein
MFPSISYPCPPSYFRKRACRPWRNMLPFLLSSARALRRPLLASLHCAARASDPRLRYLPSRSLRCSRPSLKQQQLPEAACSCDALSCTRGRRAPRTSSWARCLADRALATCAEPCLLTRPSAPSQQLTPSFRLASRPDPVGPALDPLALLRRPAPCWHAPSIQGAFRRGLTRVGVYVGNDGRVSELVRDLLTLVRRGLSKSREKVIGNLPVAGRRPTVKVCVDEPNASNP